MMGVGDPAVLLRVAPVASRQLQAVLTKGTVNLRLCVPAAIEAATTACTTARKVPRVTIEVFQEQCNSDQMWAMSEIVGWEDRASVAINAVQGTRQRPRSQMAVPGRAYTKSLC